VSGAQRIENVGGLRCRFASEGDGPVVVLLHGFGAPGGDLVALAGAIDAPHGTTFVFPEAPLELPWGFDARAWWLIDMERLERAVAGGTVNRLVDETPDGLDAARERVQSMLEELRARPSLHGRPLVLGGFSQGAMLACDVALRTADVGDLAAPAGLALMSTTILSARAWTERMARLAGCRVLLSHGTADPLLPFSVAGRLRDLLLDAGADVRWIPFRGGHEIPPPVLEGLSAVIADVAHGT
jgi:phospholipase/carboxylesterase